MSSTIDDAIRFRRPFGLVAPVVIVCLFLTFGLLVVGCGAGSPESDVATNSSTGAGATTTTTGAGSGATVEGGKQLGEAVSALWTEAMQRLDATLDGLPPVEDIKSTVAALKEEYVQKLVALGKQRQSMDAPAKAEADSTIVAALAAAAGEPWYMAYMDYYDEYAYQSGDVDFVNLLAGFNILTQYADFELLASQAPDEAERLGVK